MAAGLALHVAVNDFVLSVCKALSTCDDAKDLQLIMQTLCRLGHHAASLRLVQHQPTFQWLDSAVAQSYVRVLHGIQGLGRTSGALTVFTPQHVESITFTLLPGEELPTAADRQHLILLAFCNIVNSVFCHLFPAILTPFFCSDSRLCT